MITQVSQTDFIDAFKAIRPDNFTYNGLKTLYAYLEDLANSTGQEHKLNVGDLCSEYQEFKNWAEFEEDFGTDFVDLEKLHDYTIVIPISEEFTAMDIDGIMSSNKDGFIIRAF